MNAASKLMVVHDTKNIKRLKSDRVLTAPCGSEAFGKLTARRAFTRLCAGQKSAATSFAAYATDRLYRVLARSYEDLIASA
jgi:hypothetical protein